MADEAGNSPWRRRIYEIIFEHRTPSGKLFDLVLILLILASIVVVMLDSVRSLRADWGDAFLTLEWIFTIIFTVEYLLRLACLRRPGSYAKSFYGIIDLFAVLPTWLSIVLPGSGQVLVVIRILRVLRVFRVLKLVQYVGEAGVLARALRASRYKITVFLLVVVAVVVIVGSLMYLIEGRESGFTSIPISIYWAIVTLTTVGYGDISPATVLGQTLASVLMIMGYGIIAVPTGIVSVELAEATRTQGRRAVCSQCGLVGHDADARHCKLCGGAVTLTAIQKATPPAE